jgi:hypothetical protein
MVFSSLSQECFSSLSQDGVRLDMVGPTSCKGPDTVPDPQASMVLDWVCEGP